MITLEEPPGSIEFHNAVPEFLPAKGGLLLPRYPRSVRRGMEALGAQMAQDAAGVEMRWVTDSPHLRVFLSSLESNVDVTIFRGDFQIATHQLLPGGVQCLTGPRPDGFASVHEEALHNGWFHSDVWRLVCNRGPIVFHGIETLDRPIRLPAPEEKPRLRWLAYGSSITHSSRQGYPHLAARRLGVDVQNKGLSGSCFIEKEVVEFLTRCEWDFATFELGVNMGARFEPDEFESRARHLVERCLQAKPGRPIFLLTIFPNASHFLRQPPADARGFAFDQRLRRVTEEFTPHGVHLIEGAEIVRNLSYLGVDLLHPTDYGHMLMAENLAGALRPFVDPLRPSTNSEKTGAIHSTFPK